MPDSSVNSLKFFPVLNNQQGYRGEAPLVRGPNCSFALWMLLSVILYKNSVVYLLWRDGLCLMKVTATFGTSQRFQQNWSLNKFETIFFFRDSFQLHLLILSQRTRLPQNTSRSKCVCRVETILLFQVLY